MDTSYRTSLELNQKQQLSQSQIQSLNILALDNGELSEFLQNEYIENPILDYSPSPLPIPFLKTGVLTSRPKTRRKSKPFCWIS